MKGSNRSKKEDSPGYGVSGTAKLMNQDPFKNAIQEMQGNIIKQLSDQMQDVQTDFKAGTERTNLKIDSFTEIVEKVDCRLTKVE